MQIRHHYIMQSLRRLAFIREGVFNERFLKLPKMLVSDLLQHTTLESQRVVTVDSKHLWRHVFPLGRKAVE